MLREQYIIRSVEIPTPGGGYNKVDALFRGSVNLGLDIEWTDDQDVRKTTRILFSHVSAIRFSNERFSHEVSGSNGAIVEIGNSTWLTEICRADIVGSFPFDGKHFAVFLRDVGYYEVIADEFSVEIV